MTSPAVTREVFGHLPGGGAVEAVTLRNAAGLSARIISLGASIQSMIVPDREGRMADVALGYPTLEAYLAGSEYFGSTVGRVANRIAGGCFELDGLVYRVPVNNGPNSLHGGTPGFDKVNWEVIETADQPVPSVTLRHRSPDGEQGYPGALESTAAFGLDESGRLTIDYRATADAPTVVNLSNHAYWNLGGEGAAEGAMDHLLTIPAEHFLPTDATAIPTGEFRRVAGTPFDFRAPTAIGARVRDGADEQIRFGRGYDHHWAVSREPAAEPRLLARVEEPRSGRVLEVHSNQPGLQFYSGNFLDGTVGGKSGRLYRQGDAVVLEPQMPPDTPNQPQFGSVRLAPGETYSNRIIFAFSVR
jgi:aldose 1-epimerase